MPLMEDLIRNFSGVESVELRGELVNVAVELTNFHVLEILPSITAEERRAMDQAAVLLVLKYLGMTGGPFFFGPKLQIQRGSPLGHIFERDLGVNPKSTLFSSSPYDEAAARAIVGEMTRGGVPPSIYASPWNGGGGAAGPAR